MSQFDITSLAFIRLSELRNLPTMWFDKSNCKKYKPIVCKANYSCEKFARGIIKPTII